MENNRSLLHDFDLARAKAGEAICWSYLHIPCSFVGEAAYGKVAMKNDGGFIEIVNTSSLRMKPLFWKDSKPVYKGDKLWHKITKKFIEVDCLQDEMGAAARGFFVDTDGINVMAELCLWEEPKPEPLFQHEGKDVQVRYANVYIGNNQPMLGPIHFTKESAEKNASCGSRGVARIEWQE